MKTYGIRFLIKFCNMYKVNTSNKNLEFPLFFENQARRYRKILSSKIFQDAFYYINITITLKKYFPIFRVAENSDIERFLYILLRATMSLSRSRRGGRFLSFFIDLPFRHIFSEQWGEVISNRAIRVASIHFTGDSRSERTDGTNERAPTAHPWVTAFVIFPST